MIKSKVLFPYTENSCRTQMAEALLRDLAEDRFDIVSAGADPGRVDPEAIAAMRVLGFDLSGQTPKEPIPRRAVHLRYYVVRSRARKNLPDFSGSDLAPAVEP